MQASLDHVYHAISDPTRRAVLMRLAAGETSIGELSKPYAMTLPAFSKHIRVLEQAGLVSKEKRGRTYYCQLVPGPLEDATEWLEFYRRFWERKLADLDNYLRENP